MACYEARNARTEIERETDLARQLRAIERATQRARREAGDKPLDVLLQNHVYPIQESLGYFV